MPHFYFLTKIKTTKNLHTHILGANLNFPVVSCRSVINDSTNVFTTKRNLSFYILLWDPAISGWLDQIVRIQLKLRSRNHLFKWKQAVNANRLMVLCWRSRAKANAHIS